MAAPAAPANSLLGTSRKEKSGDVFLLLSGGGLRSCSFLHAVPNWSVCIGLQEAEMKAEPVGIIRNSYQFWKEPACVAPPGFTVASSVRPIQTDLLQKKTGYKGLVHERQKVSFPCHCLVSSEQTRLSPCSSITRELLSCSTHFSPTQNNVVTRWQVHSGLMKPHTQHVTLLSPTSCHEV